MHPQANPNPFKQALQQNQRFVQQLGNGGRLHGKYNFLGISPEAKLKIQDAFLQIQTICLPTIQALSKNENIIQLQEKLYQSLLKYETQFNICLVKARTPQQSEYCGDKMYQNLTVHFKPELKYILDQY